MDETFNFRNANKNDVVGIIELGEKLQNESKEFEPNLYFDKTESIAHYIKELNNKNALIVIAEKDNYIVGYQYSYITNLDYLDDKNLECTFEAIYVLPELRSIGIAKKLASMSEDWAINKKKVDRIKANIYAGNIASENLHLKHGFRLYCSKYIKIINKS